MVIPESEGRMALASVEAAWNAAGRPWDARALAAIYTDDALFFGGRPDHAVGHAAIAAYFGSYEAVIDWAQLALVDQHVLSLGPGIHLAQGWAEFSFLLAGQRATKSRLRATLLMVRQEDTWRIRQHHFSPPPEVPPLGDS